MSAGRNKVNGADLVQEEKHALQLRALTADQDGDFDEARAFRYAVKCLQSVEDRLRAAADPASCNQPAPVMGSSMKADEREAKADRMICPSCCVDQPTRVFDLDSGLCAMCEDMRRRGQ